MTERPYTEMLSRPECLRLLGIAPFGRLVYTIAALPAIQPVNFVVRGNSIIIHTASDSKLAAATASSVVAFEVDHIDTRSRAGWSVCVVGRSHEVVDPVELADLALAGPEAWGMPDSVRVIAVQIEQITGRWLHSPVAAVASSQ